MSIQKIEAALSQLESPLTIKIELPTRRVNITPTLYMLVDKINVADVIKLRNEAEGLPLLIKTRCNLVVDGEKWVLSCLDDLTLKAQMILTRLASSFLEAELEGIADFM